MAQLLLAVEACQSLETQQGLEKRRRIVQELDTLVKQWVRTEGMRHGLHWGEGERAGGKVVTYGSYKLGVVDRESDLDLLCVVPRQVSRDDFFSHFYISLAKKAEVSELRSLSKAYIPVIKFRYKDIDVDLTRTRTS